LLEVVSTRGAGGRLANFLHGRQQQADQDRNDGDDDEEFEEGEGAAGAGRVHGMASREWARLAIVAWGGGESNSGRLVLAPN